MLISARGFYLVMFALFYVAVFKYPNHLRDANLSGEFPYVILYIMFQVVSIYLFLKTGENPGFVDATETPLSRREKSKLFVGHYDEFKDVHD